VGSLYAKGMTVREIRNHLEEVYETEISPDTISKITDEFLAYMQAMEFLDLNLGGEWLEMAAMLVYIKSKMLLPKPEVEEDEDGPDPREELVKRLLEYQKYKAAAEALDERDLLSRDVFVHPPRASDYVEMLGPPPEPYADQMGRSRKTKCRIESTHVAVLQAPGPGSSRPSWPGWCWPYCPCRRRPKQPRNTPLRPDGSLRATPPRS